MVNTLMYFDASVRIFGMSRQLRLGVVGQTALVNLRSGENNHRTGCGTKLLYTHPLHGFIKILFPQALCTGLVAIFPSRVPGC